MAFGMIMGVAKKWQEVFVKKHGIASSGQQEGESKVQVYSSWPCHFVRYLAETDLQAVQVLPLGGGYGKLFLHMR